FCTDNLELLLNNLKQKKGFLIYQTLLSKNAKKINDVQFRQNNIAFVFGNEGNGISQNIQKLSDCDLYIPINFESLNVACA
ncbi:rRNA methyltransferase, partial [Rhizobium sp. KAs_5_22]